MIISVSIVDNHKPRGHRHVGTYTFEIDYPGDSHFDFLTVACPVETENEMRQDVGKLLTLEDLKNSGGGYRCNSLGEVLEKF
jgi:hypothetical protein